MACDGQSKHRAMCADGARNASRFGQAKWWKELLTSQQSGTRYFSKTVRRVGGRDRDRGRG